MGRFFPSSSYLLYTLPSMPGYVRTRWSEDGSQLLTLNNDLDSNSYVSIWNASNGQSQSRTPVSSVHINDFERNPMGDDIAFVDDVGEMTVWKPSHFQATVQVWDRNKRLMAIAWSPDGTKLASVGKDMLIEVQDVATMQYIATFADSTQVDSVKWSPDGTKLATVNDDGTLKIWDVSDLPEVRGIPTITPFPTLTPSKTPTSSS